MQGLIPSLKSGALTSFSTLSNTSESVEGRPRLWRNNFGKCDYRRYTDSKVCGSGSMQGEQTQSVKVVFKL